MRSLLHLVAGVVLALPACSVAIGQHITTPSEHLGRPLGADFELADWNEVSSYYRKLGDESPNVLTLKAGETTEGRDFLITIISSQENLAQLDRIKSYAQTIADPRGKSDAELQTAIADGKVILFVSCQMHSTEAAGSQFSMEFAHTLATSNNEPYKSARDNLVVVIYTTNPDGLDHVVEWYRETVGTPHEASGLPKLYQFYTGHDNNRDWFMLTQNETRIVTDLLYSQWRPQVYWDVHQQGSSRERMFVPPFRDPLNPNLDPAIISGIDALGSRALLDMTREGLAGISTGVSYDMWWNGGNRNVPVRHNIIGLLTEAASVRLASPIFLPKSDLRAPRGLDGYVPSNQFPNPWPGGWWRLRDIIDYEMAFGRSLLGSLGREPQTWLRNSLEAAERTIAKGRESPPRAWLIPSDNRDPGAVKRLVDVLLRAGVEIHVTDAPIQADERSYPAGTIVIFRGQPYGSHVKDLFEVQRYPDGKPPYDVAGWTLPFLLGVRRVEVIQKLDGPLERVTSADDAIAGFGGDPRLLDQPNNVMSSQHSGTWTKVVNALTDGRAITFAATGEREGLFFASEQEANDQEALVTLERFPRIGLYSPWSGSMDEGWMRYVFDTFEFPYVTVRNEMLRAGALGDFLDVLIIPSVGSGQLDQGRESGSVPDDYAGGLAPEGAIAVEEFVRGGGTLVTLGSSCQWAIDLFEFPLVDVTREEKGREFSCPGSVLRGIPKDNHPMTAGLDHSVALFFSRSAAYRLMTEKERKEAELQDDRSIETLLRYAPTRLLLSGWVRKPEVIENQGAWIRVEHGAGRVHLFAFRPQFRAWTQATFALLFRAILFEQAD